jgi:nicotinate-nucleotide adenylyltransferase
MKVGILGGTFDPVHVGHLLAAHAVREAHGLDRILLVPAATSPHKRGAVTAPAADRVAMLRLCATEDPWLEVCTAEVDRGGLSYAVETVRSLRAAHPDWRLHLVIGTDCLKDLHLWREVGELLALCTVVPVLRPGSGNLPRASQIALPAPWPRRLLRRAMAGRLCEISSSEIRRRVAARLPIRYLVPPAVEDYIREHGLYGSRPAAGGRPRRPQGSKRNRPT